MAPRMADLQYDPYEEAIRRKAADSPADFAREPAGAYRRHAGGFVPEPRPGCTVLAEPYPITSVAGEMAALQDVLGELCPEFAAVPIQTLHLTIADLIARDAYAGLTGGEQDEFCARAATILAGFRFPQHATGTIAGVGVFPSVVVALVSFTPAAYRALMTVREAIHAGLGLFRPYPFTGHLTLGYVEIPADAVPAQRDKAVRAVGAARQAHAQGARAAFRFDRAAVYTFEHMSRFDLWVPGRPGPRAASVTGDAGRAETAAVARGVPREVEQRLIEGDVAAAIAVARAGESPWVELAARQPQLNAIARDLTAFANSDGGVLICGIGEHGEVSGWRAAEAEAAARRITSVATSALPRLVHVRQARLDEGYLVWAVVSRAAEPMLTAAGSYWLREANHSREAEPPARSGIAEDQPAIPALSGLPLALRVFVAMSFREEEEPALADYWHAMKRAAARADGEFELRRIDQVDDDYEIIGRIYQEIDAADLVIADLTLSSANVYLELGYARGRGKHIIQTCRQDTPLEFDVRGRRTLIYRNATTLEDKLLRHLNALRAEAR